MQKRKDDDSYFQAAGPNTKPVLGMDELNQIYEEAEKDGAPLIKGGQGRSDEALQEDAMYGLILIGFLGLPILGYILWRVATWQSA